MVYLDFDGVLRPSGKGWSSTCVAALNNILLFAGSEIVVTSEWRLRNDLDQLQKLLVDAGMRNGLVVGATLVGGSRAQEIYAHLVATEQIKAFFILDDAPLPEVPWLGLHQQRPRFTTGLTPEHAERARTQWLQCWYEGSPR